MDIKIFFKKKRYEEIKNKKTTITECEKCLIEMIDNNNYLCCPKCSKIAENSKMEKYNIKYILYGNFQYNSKYCNTQYNTIMNLLNKQNENFYKIYKRKKFCQKTLKDVYDLYNKYIFSPKIIRRSYKKKVLLYLFLYYSSFLNDELRLIEDYTIFFDFNKKHGITAGINEIFKITNYTDVINLNFDYKKILISMLNDINIKKTNILLVKTIDGIFENKYKNTIYNCVCEIYDKIIELKICTNIKDKSLLSGIVIIVLCKSECSIDKPHTGSLLNIGQITVEKIEHILHMYNSRFMEIYSYYNLKL